MPPVRCNVAITFGSSASTLRRAACLDPVDGIVHGGEQLRPTVPVQSVGVGDESQPGRPVGGPPADPGLVDVVLDRYAEAGELRQVVDRPTRRGELEVEQRDRDAVTEDDVRELHVVVAHERPARGIGQRVVPGGPSGSKPRAASCSPRSSRAMDASAVSDWLQSG